MPATLAPFVAAPPAIYLLAEHLDAVLAVGEDLVALVPPVAPTERLDGDRLTDMLAAELRFIAEIEALETKLLARVLQARVRALEVARIDPRFRQIVGLFVSGTAVCLAAVDRHGPAGRAARRDAVPEDRVTFLAERALLDPLSSAALPRRPDAAFRALGVIEIGPLLDLVATFLSTLEVHYELFDAADAALGETVQSATTLVTTAEDDVRVL